MRNFITLIGSSKIRQLFVLFSVFTYATAGLANDCSRIVALESYASTRIAPAGSTCESFQGLSAYTGIACYWKFSFRDAEAANLAGALWSEIVSCRIGVQSRPDVLVNHPDSFDQKEMIVGSDVFRVSLKDKGGEKSTYVFVKFEQKR